MNGGKPKHGTTIEWTHGAGFRGETWNPAVGCSKVSAGCRSCYAEQVHKLRLNGVHGYPVFEPWTKLNAAHNVTMIPERLDIPLHWKQPRMVFVNSMSDMFHELLPAEYIAEVYAVMWLAHEHIFQVLTKRPERAVVLLNDPEFWRLVEDAIGTRSLRRASREGGTPLPGVEWDPVRTPPTNVWLGTTIETRKWVGRADDLRATPAAVRFISAEPLLGPLLKTPARIPVASERLPPDWTLETHDDGYGLAPPSPHMWPRPETRWATAQAARAAARSVDSGYRGGQWRDGHGGPELDLTGIDWLIAGGESGPKHRPMDPQWACDLRDACLRERLLRANGSTDGSGGPAFFFKQWGGRTPRAGGRELEGRTWDEMPQTPQLLAAARAAEGE